MGENMYRKRRFKNSLKIRVCWSLFHVKKNVLMILLGSILSIVIYHSKWYSSKTVVTPYIAALVYTPLYLFCQTRFFISFGPHISLRMKITDRFKITAADRILSAFLWGLFVSFVQLSLSNYLWNLLLLQKFILSVLYFMAVSAIIHILYIYTKNPAISFSLSLSILIVDYYLSVFGNIMGVKGVILYTVFAGTSFIRDFLTILILNLVLEISQVYLYSFNMDLIE